MHLSNTRLNFISFESLLKGICNRHQQSTRMKVHKKPCHTVFGLNVAGRLVSQCILCQTNRRPSPNQSKTGHLCIFRDFSFSSTLFLKVHKISHSMVKWVFFIIENIQIHHCICLLLILPFEIDFALSGICFLRKCDFVTFSWNLILLKEVSVA